MKNDVVYIKLDRERELRFGHKALKKLVALTGKSLEDIEQEGFQNLELVEKLVYCGLLKDAKDHGETLKLEEMEDLLDDAPNYKHIIEKVQIAFLAAFGVSPEPTEGNHPEPAELPETESGSTGKNRSE